MRAAFDVESFLLIPTPRLFINRTVNVNATTGFSGGRKNVIGKKRNGKILITLVSICEISSWMSAPLDVTKAK